MTTLSRFLAWLHAHKLSAWIGLFAYACAVTFPHQPVQNVVGALVVAISRNRVYQISVALAFIEAAVVCWLFFRNLARQPDRLWHSAYWTLCFLLMVGTWRYLMANNTELVHYPQYFPEGVALLAITLSPVESLAWISLFGGLDEAYQYIYLTKGRATSLDFNDIYMDLIGGGAGIIFAMVLLRNQPRSSAPETGEPWGETLKRILKKPGVLVIFALLAVSAVLLWTGAMILYEPLNTPTPHWFALSNLETEFWYYNDKVLGPHHFHETDTIEGVLLILFTIALFLPLERKLNVLPNPVPKN
jgi:hypothetical protein